MPVATHRRKAGRSIFTWRIAGLAVVQSYLIGSQLERTLGLDRAPAPQVMSMPGMPDMLMPGGPRALSPGLHGLRNSTLAVPFAVVALLLIAVVLRAIVNWSGRPADGTTAKLLFAFGAGVASMSFLLSDALAGLVFSEPLSGVPPDQHYLHLAFLALRYSFALGLLYAAFFGVPWTPKSTLPNASSQPSLREEI